MSNGMIHNTHKSLNPTNQSSPADLRNKRKQYYLASSTENIQMLSELQQKELSTVLFELRSQHDKLTLDSSIQMRKEEELKKKIKQIQSRDKEINAVVKKKKARLSSIQSSTEIKQIKKTEENYNNKILSSNISKIKLDILLTNKGANRYQEEESKIDIEINKSIIQNNNQKSKYNTVHRKILDQNERNVNEREEQILQLEYYQEIIDQKRSFIEAANERKMRQEMIAAKAKNNSNDVNEIAIRRKLLLLKVINHYYALKMNKMIIENQELEEAYGNIRDICGTNKLSDICESISNKDKITSFKASLIDEKKKQRQLLKQHLTRVSKEYTKLLNEEIVNTPGELNVNVNAKAIQIDCSVNKSKEHKELVEKERELTAKLDACRDKQLLVNLIYHKTIENMKYLYRLYVNDFEKGNLNYNESNSDINQTRNMTTFETNTNELQLSSRLNEEEDIKDHNKDISTYSYNNNQSNEDKALCDYRSFLKQSFDSFNKLFFCYSKQTFIRAMHEKGIEKTNNNSSSTPISRNNLRTSTKSSLSRVNRRSSVRKRTKKLYMSLSTEVVKKQTIEEDEEEGISPEEKMNQKDIMASFLHEIKREKEEYIRSARRKPT